MFNDIKELEDLISNKQRALERNNKILSDLDHISDEEYREREKGKIQEEIERLNEEISSLQSQRESMKPNEEIVEKIKKYEDLEVEERELISRREFQERELAALENNRPEEPDQDYFDRLNEYNESIEAISKHIDNVREELASLDRDFELYPDEEISKAIANASSTPKEEETAVEEEIGYEITQEIEELEKKYNDVALQGDEAQKEIHTLSSELTEAYAKQIKRYETLIRKNNGSEPEYVSYLTEKIKEAQERQDYFQSVSEDTLPEEIEVEENFDDKEVSQLEEETIEAQISINDLEEKLKEAKENKEYFDKEAIRFSQELVEKNQELIDMINASELQERQELKALERDQATKRLQLAIEKRDSYQQIIDNLQSQIDRFEDLQSQIDRFQPLEEEDKEPIEEKAEEEERVVTRTYKQLLADMETMSQTLEKRQAEWDDAVKALEDYRTENGIDTSQAEREISKEEQKLINQASKAERAYNNQYNSLLAKQEDYKVAAASINAVGTEKENKLINAEDGSLIGDRPAFTDASAMVEGQIDGSALKEDLDDEEPETPSDDSADDTPEVEDPGDKVEMPPVTEPDEPKSKPGKDGEEEEPKEPIKGPIPPVEEPKVEKKKGRVLEKILVDIYTDKETGEPINVTHLQRKRLERSQISVTKNFLNDVNNGGVLYNVTSVAGAVIRMPLSLVQKITGKILTTRRTKENMKKIRENIQELSEEDKEVLFTEYTNNKAFQDRAKGADQIILEEAIAWKRQNEINPKVAEAGNIFAGVFSAYETNMRLQSIVDALNDGMSLEKLKDIPGIPVDVNGVTKEQLISEITGLQKAVMAGKASDLARFRELNKELAAAYSGGGIHGMEEEVRAKSTKMNERGKRFSSDVGTADDFEGRVERADVEQALVDAIEAGDDLAAATLFVKGEQLKYEAQKQGLTFVKILGVPIMPAGIGDKGTIKYMPIAQEMDYRPDPFIRNMITTIATVATITHAIGQIQHQIEMKRANEENLAQQGYVRSKGEELSSKGDELQRSMDHRREADFAASRNHQEMTDTYYTNPENYGFNDPHHHIEIRDTYQAVNERIQDINQQMQSGQISPTQGYEQIMELNKEIHGQYVESLRKALPDVEHYAATHTQHDYNVLLPAMRKIVEDPNAGYLEDQALLDAIRTGEELEGFTIAEISPHLADTIIGLGGAALITGYVASQGQKAYKKPDMSLVDIVEDSIEFQEKMFDPDKEIEYEDDYEDEDEYENVEDRYLDGENVEDKYLDLDNHDVEEEFENDMDKEKALREMLGDYAPESEQKSVKMP